MSRVAAGAIRLGRYETAFTVVIPLAHGLSPHQAIRKTLTGI